MSLVPYKTAVSKIRSKIKDASPTKVHIYPFNIPPGDLESAVDLLDRVVGLGSMRVTYSDDHNFVIRLLPGVHEGAIDTWVSILTAALLHARLLLLTEPQALDQLLPGFSFIGRRRFNFKGLIKQPDSGIRPTGSDHPSVVLEVGDSDSLAQLRFDAMTWLERMAEVQMVVLLSISPPRITIELWKMSVQQGQARQVWSADWTHNATPLYMLFTDIFGGRTPPAEYGYGDIDRVYLATEAWRQSIIDNF